MDKCLFCGIIFQQSDNFCKNCGRKIFREFNLANIGEIYNIVTAERKFLSENFRKYREESYPTGNTFGEQRRQYRALLGALYTMGYNIRTSESLFKRLLFDDFEYKVKDDSKIMNILSSTEDNYNKISKITELLDLGGTTIGIGRHAAKFSIIGIDNIIRFLDFVLNSFYESRLDELNAILSDKEILWRNAVAGYYFKLAEEIVENIK